jgi:hypothetical protein
MAESSVIFMTWILTLLPMSVLSQAVAPVAGVGNGANFQVRSGVTGVCPYPGKLGWLKHLREANETAVVEVVSIIRQTLNGQ